MAKQPPENLRDFESLLEIMKTLAGPEGCPWDKEQNHTTLIPYLIEEAHEVVEAIEQNDQSGMVEELGDLLLQIVFHAELGRQSGQFEIADVISSINDKMVRRHPHVFANITATTADQVKQNWDEIKMGEKKAQGKSETPNLGGPLGVPALQRSHKIGEKTRRQAFDWPNIQGVWQKLEEETSELKESMTTGGVKEIEHELGDVLFTVAQLARHLKLDPEAALRKANQRFENRYFDMLQLASEKKQKWEQLTNEQKEMLWQEVKRQQKTAGPKASPRE